MAYFRFNVKNLHLDVLVGALENYKPSKKVKDVFKKTESLKSKTLDFLLKEFNTDDFRKIKKIMDDNKKKAKIWDKFFKETYLPEVTEITNIIKKLNEDLAVKQGEMDE